MDISSPTVSSSSSPRGVALEEEPLGRVASRTTVVALRNIPSKRREYALRAMAWTMLGVIGVLATVGTIACWGIALVAASLAGEDKGWAAPSWAVNLTYTGVVLCFVAAGGLVVPNARHALGAACRVRCAHDAAERHQRLSEGEGI